MLKGYATEAFVMDKIKKSESQPIKGAATESWVINYLANALSGISVDGVITDYRLLTNKPSIGGVQLIDDVSLDDLGLVRKEVYEAKITELENKLAELATLVDEHLNPKGAVVHGEKIND